MAARPPAKARLDRVKNLSGLVDWFGRSPDIRQEANLLVVGGYEAAADSYYQARVNNAPAETIPHAGGICVPITSSKAIVELSVRRAQQREPAQTVRFHVRDDANGRATIVGVER